ncbi:MAG: calcium-translocating P-type ATPase, PMCA-type [Candidatus Caldarchaeum sp.]|nr:calcium-translocating P-type ATPase, PMCA-type [Candidatus Caldarchaeum sp.]MCX8200801.1 calcium-translocating P-type ATPase, PMCA-type [Candidatus Caldarchaeum sp.]MDW8434682.1 calcium-translocating P-type ATPase, PMCA-type [Candidatus Caldarchaeum sp.]
MLEAEAEKSWHAKTVDEVVAKLGTDPVRGLSNEEAAKRLKIYGYNELEKAPKPSALKIFLKQFANILIGLLLAALVISAFFGEVIDSLVIGVIVFFVAVVGFFQEYRAEKTLEALKKMLTPVVTVVREGRDMEVPSKELVPGDVVILSTGTKVPADMRVIEAFNLQTNEAPLTGESTPVQKTTIPMPENVGIGDRLNMAYAGTIVTYGRGKGIVVATGSRTEFGKIATATSALAEEKTPLEIRMDEIGKRFAVFAGVIIAAIFVVELLRELLAGFLSLSFLVEVFLFAVALAVAIVPEALPGIVTATLAIGMGIMAKRNALVRRMPAVETLGSTQVICFDKTGTLTMNQMTVRQLFIDGKFMDVDSFRNLDRGADMFVKACVLCNDASVVVENGKPVVHGDPTEGALVLFARELGVDVDAMRKTYPRVYEVPFTSERKLMTTFHSMEDGEVYGFMKGAVETVLPKCAYVWDGSGSRPNGEEVRKIILNAAEEMAKNAYRVLAVAYRRGFVENKFEEEGFVFLGLVGMMDPPRPEAYEAVKKAREAGIRTVMVTGDHRLTALAVAKEVGIYREGDLVLTGEEVERLSDEEFDRIVERVVVYARISPMHKLRIVEAWKRKGYVVAMTGDGVNDAPALKKADIGVAMGITGTDVAKESSDMVLADDNFATIVKAVELGRWIYGNVRKYLVYLLEANLVETIVIAGVALVIAELLGLKGEDALPLLPVHILYINLATDGLPAIALGFSPPDPDIMKRKPTPRNEPVFNREVVNLLLTIVTVATPLYLIGYLTALSEGVEQARTRLFLMFIANELVLALNCRSLVYTNFEARPHKWLWLAIAWEIGLITAILTVPGGASLLRLTTPSTGDLFWIFGGAAFVYTSVELSKVIRRRGLRLITE